MWRVARRATAAGAGAFTVALAVGVAAFFVSLEHAMDERDTSAVMPSMVLEGMAAELRELSEVRTRAIEPSAVDVIQLGVRGVSFELDRDGASGDPAMAIAATASSDEGTGTLTDDGEVAGEAVTAAAASAALIPVTLSFYYCEPGEDARYYGDGGGFCGPMRDGRVVFEGAAACAYSYLGQRFRVVGDPYEREYVCADTGNAVHGEHRDIWFMDSDEGGWWMHAVGEASTIEVLP